LSSVSRACSFDCINTQENHMDSDEPVEPVIGAERPVPAAEPAHGANAEILAALKRALAATIPGADASLVEGDSLEEVEASAAALRASARPPVVVPAGAPGRSSAAPATPFDKIREGLGRL